MKYLKKLKYVVFVAALFCFCTKVQAGCSLIVQNMKCEYLSNPSGLDEPHPRFSWTLSANDANAYGLKQTEYRILVAKTKQELDKNTGDMWSTGWIRSSESLHIVYQGKPLESDRTYYWKVQVKDEKKHKSGWSSTSYWSTGLFHSSDWTTKWIGSGEV